MARVTHSSYCLSMMAFPNFHRHFVCGENRRPIWCIHMVAGNSQSAWHLSILAFQWKWSTKKLPGIVHNSTCRNRGLLAASACGHLVVSGCEQNSSCTHMPQVPQNTVIVNTHNCSHLHTHLNADFKRTMVSCPMNIYIAYSMWMKFLVSHSTSTHMYTSATASPKLPCSSSVLQLPPNNPLLRRRGREWGPFWERLLHADVHT